MTKTAEANASVRSFLSWFIDGDVNPYSLDEAQQLARAACELGWLRDTGDGWAVTPAGAAVHYNA